MSKHLIIADADGPLSEIWPIRLGWRYVDGEGECEVAWGRCAWGQLDDTIRDAKAKYAPFEIDDRRGTGKKIEECSFKGHESHADEDRLRTRRHTAQEPI